MIRLRISKLPHVAKVLKTIAREMQAVSNKTTKRVSDRRIVRILLDSNIGLAVESAITKAQELALASPQYNHHRDDRDYTPTKLQDKIIAALMPYYDGDCMNDEPLAYQEELAELIAAYAAAVEVAKGDVFDVVRQTMTDTKTNCGFADTMYGAAHGSIVLLTNSEMSKVTSNDPFNNGITRVTSTTVGAAKVLIEAEKKQDRARREDKSKEEVKEYLTCGAYWYDKTDSKFISMDEILNVADIDNHEIVAYEYNSNDEFRRW